MHAAHYVTLHTGALSTQLEEAERRMAELEQARRDSITRELTYLRTRTDQVSLEAPVSSDDGSGSEDYSEGDELLGCGGSHHTAKWSAPCHRQQLPA